ncbi:hypothetical protein D1164_14050 [Mariniphaga sediminis]|uniref:Heparinase II C-terminal domain-containing protein n=1 Tax=Mariniphaga sediminis TaxID=1628158 RepID=A0A399CZW3_9BACT|nr:hypothetical protein [Mariniphaga sediminis]RIH64478.1 hypothetical protein D1164_14050 [Mariniphaga sediminis]
MKRYFRFSLLILAVVFSSFINKRNAPSLKKENNTQDFFNKPVVIRLDAEMAIVNAKSAEIVEDKRLSNNRGIALKPNVPAAINGERTEADLTFRVKVPPGRYVINTFAVTDKEGAEAMKKATSKFESLYAKIQIDNKQPTKRIVYVPWDVPKQELGKFNFNGEDQQLKIWLPRGVRFEYIQLSSYKSPQVPELAENYQPKVIPPPGRPRLWVNQQSLPEIRARLEAGENLKEWWKVKKSALIPYVFEFDPDKEVSFDAGLEKAAKTKAFYYLMTDDKRVGKEAIKLMADYISHVEFGNLLDITREIGRAIYTASLVYDWCYDLLTSEEKQIIYNNLMRLAEDMEIGWPPFKQSIIIGHGNEAQINRDLLSMSIAIYDEDPLPYQYCSYRILEELVPMRNWEYQSPRHNQGVNYGAYRIGWDLHAAWLFNRMTGQPVFAENIKNVSRFWVYMRLPNGQMLRDGDGFNAGPPGEFYYWSHPQTMFLFYTYAEDPIIKAEFERQGGALDDPVLFLLLNDPELQAEPGFESLPLTMDFGPILGSMVARTGWNIGLTSNDVVAEIKGGGFHFGNHQHSDAGSIQVYYRGFQVGDIGLYGFYGTPYDYNFNKRSVAHSMMLARDPGEKFGNTESNDGGTRFNQRNPKSPKEAENDPWFNNGKVLSSDFGPSKLHPFFSYFSVDLVGAYSSKIKSYTREFCFLNLDKDSIPAAIILNDNITTANPSFKKYWQINTHNKPQINKNTIVLNNERRGLTGKTTVTMLIPAIAERYVEVLSGADAVTSFEYKYELPGRLGNRDLPEKNGHRIMVSPKVAKNNDRFLTVFQLTAGDTEPLPVKNYQTKVSNVIIIADRVVSMSKGNGFVEEEFTLNIPEGLKFQIILTGMKAGSWNVKSKDGKMKFNTTVREDENTIFFLAGSGEYIITPGWLTGSKTLITDEEYRPKKR